MFIVLVIIVALSGEMTFKPIKEVNTIDECKQEAKRIMEGMVMAYPDDVDFLITCINKDALPTEPEN